MCFSNGVKTVKDIYTAYKIMPMLQLHQLRVAAVGKLVCAHFKEAVNADDVVLACLFHDMGNILKFDFSVFPDSVQPEGLAYWEGVKEEFRSKYGDEQHQATLTIAKELGLLEPVLACIDSVAFSKAETVLESGSWGEKICKYADGRVSPMGIRSLDERLREARKRYAGRKTATMLLAPEERFEELVAAEHAIEKELFSNATITPEDITDAAVEPLIKELSEYPVP